MKPLSIDKTFRDPYEIRMLSSAAHGSLPIVWFLMGFVPGRVWTRTLETYPYSPETISLPFRSGTV